MKNRNLLSLVLCVLIAGLLGCGGDSGTNNQGGGGTVRLTVTSINPATLSRGAQGVALTITGAGFTGDVLVDLGAGVTVDSKQVPNSQTVEVIASVIPSASPGPRTVTVTSGSNSARLDAALTISDNKAPVAFFFSNPTQGTPQTLFELDASGSTDADGTIATYRWQISDGTNPSGMKLKKQFSQKGEYTIRLTVTDDKGGTSSMESTIQVADNKPPQASFTMTPPNGSQLTTFTFDGSASLDPDGEIRTYTWDLGGFEINGMKVTHKFTKPGDYQILLSVKDSSGSISTARKVLPVVFFDRDQAKKEISDVIVDFMKQFDDFEHIPAEEVVRGFSRSPGCEGRAKELSIIEQEKPIIAWGAVEFLGPVDVPSVDDRHGNANITNRFYGEYKDGTPYNGKATHYMSMINDPDGWRICNFYVVKY